VRYLRPPHIVWLLSHLIVFLAGVIMVSLSPNDGGVLATALTGGGASLIATGVAGHILYVYVLNAADVQAQLQLLQEAGIRSVFRARSVVIKKEYHQRIHDAAKIDLLGFGLSSFRQDYAAEFKRFAATKQVRILLQDPEFPSADNALVKLRDREEKNDVGRIAQDVRAFIEEATPVMREFPNKFQIRLVSALPSTNYFRLDDEAFWGPYLLGIPSRNMPTILVRRGGFLFKALEDHFEMLWGSDEFSKPARIDQAA
jgi:hypothetical protein